MFDSLDDQIKKDLAKESTTKQRMLLWVAMAAAAVVVFGGLIVAVRATGF
jgi:hypothetical protein